jgi:hypothetical protein
VNQITSLHETTTTTEEVTHEVWNEEKGEWVKDRRTTTSTTVTHQRPPRSNEPWPQARWAGDQG